MNWHCWATFELRSKVSFIQANKDSKKSQPIAPSRGKKGKSKKIKEKYADQDEEERELRMELLGVSVPSCRLTIYSV